MDPCWFTKNKNTNPITKQKCKQSFENRVQDNEEVLMSNDTMDQVYFAGLACIGIYVFYRIMEKSR
jgi:tRNA A22 N-methylase